MIPPPPPGISYSRAKQCMPGGQVSTNHLPSQLVSCYNNSYNNSGGGNGSTGRPYSCPLPNLQPHLFTLHYSLLLKNLFILICNKSTFSVNSKLK